MSHYPRKRRIGSNILPHCRRINLVQRIVVAMMMVEQLARILRQLRPFNALLRNKRDVRSRIAGRAIRVATSSRRWTASSIAWAVRARW